MLEKALSEAAQCANNKELKEKKAGGGNWEPLTGGRLRSADLDPVRQLGSARSLPACQERAISSVSER